MKFKRRVARAVPQPTAGNWTNFVSSFTSIFDRPGSPRAAICNSPRRGGGRVSIEIAPLSLLLTLAIGTAISVDPAIAAEPRITASSHSESSHELTPVERRSASLAASRILRHTLLARMSIANEDGKKAAAEVAQGLKLVEILESIQPEYTVSAEIKAGDLSYSADEVVRDPLVSIYSEIGEVELFDEVAAAKKEQRSQAVVVDVFAEQTAVYLNLVYARAGLEQAKRSLGEKDLELADEGLALVQRSTVFETNETDLPLETARENLFVAKTRAGLGDTAGARLALDAAAEGLDAYGRVAAPARAKQVEVLRREISKYAKNGSAGGTGASLSSDAEEKILSWWDTAVEWWEE